ncbi:Spo0B domain-containing protein [Mammaliicoccus stepanovicii]|uniref:SpoOB alpha-helical domain-containing protein n=1 Tax=Mammaliicoccus stepanovicii TaxID=643214 RepID=A0A239Z478_9STAP|nr:Spo0B domain-containing protein [Mammaliicoccus stepanovicii]PNZ72385.1 hypothetical protein CD111_11030 [Mammaliicoccus stepanovicii]GGI40225.1 hypothetical protein GCM10010896_07310 [Mammaliicoccus stepanovicii]SNV65338.1 Uncharacterised protein [Mammaliicoccus stepanovicii]
MNNLDVYLKSRHDFVNQFQLLYTYKQLGKVDEMESLLDELYNDLKQEQLFLNAPCRKFVQAVFDYKISVSGFKWTFEIECINDEYYQKNLMISDSILYEIYKIFINHHLYCDDNVQILLRLTVEEEFVTLSISFDHVDVEAKEIYKMFSEYELEIISINEEQCELEFFININELEV